MTNDNQDALRCAAECVRQSEEGNYERSLFRNSGEHLQRLAADNEAKDALLRQAVKALEKAAGFTEAHFDAIAAIRQHLDQKTT